MTDRIKTDNQNEESDQTFRALGIKTAKINKWIEDCKSWFFKTLLNKVINENITNINKLDNILNIHFNRKLNERDLLTGINYQSRDPKFDDCLTFTTIDDLLSYYNASIKNGYFWPVKSKVSREEASFHQEQLIHLIKERIRLEKYFRIRNYQVSASR
jgi:hypothetical protein